MTKRRARIFRGTPRNIAWLAARLRAGDIVGLPTETVYGLAANALDPIACAKIFAAKGRPTADPLIVHIRDLKQLSQVCEPNAAALKLAKRFWPGPLTLVLPKKPCVPDIVTAGRNSVAVRMPSHPIFRRLLRDAGVPLAAPSANPFGYISPTTAEHVRQGLAAKIDYILEGGASAIGLESTIVDLRDPRKPTLLRPGAITAAELSHTLGRRARLPVSSKARTAESQHSGQIAPGQLARHYSPRTPLVLHAKIDLATNSLNPNHAYILLRPPTRRMAKNVFWLDRHGKLRGIARSLFATLRKIDAKKFAAIHVELATGGGLAEAINDRLRRAAAR